MITLAYFTDKSIAVPVNVAEVILGEPDNDGAPDNAGAPDKEGEPDNDGLPLIV